MLDGADLDLPQADEPLQKFLNPPPEPSPALGQAVGRDQGVAFLELDDPGRLGGRKRLKD
jgi:hypothetical protein